ncbi:hypothetical protein ABVT39_012448, partial [Epinephelus coioides]
YFPAFLLALALVGCHANVPTLLRELEPRRIGTLALALVGCHANVPTLLREAPAIIGVL